MKKKPANFLVNFFRSDPDKYKHVKALLGFPVGALMGYGLYKAVIEAMLFSAFIRLTLGGLLGLALAIGFAQSVQIRCISILVFPHFFAKEGRAFIGTYAIAFLITGPIANIMLNAEEVTRSIGCTTELMVNHSMARADLRYKPIRAVLTDLQSQGIGIHRLTAQIRKAFKPIRSEVEDRKEIDKMKKDNDYIDSIDDGDHPNPNERIERRKKVNPSDSVGKRDEKFYTKKLDYRCEDVYNLGVIKCRQMFKGMLERCKSKVKIASGLFCFPFQLSMLCEIVRWLPNFTGGDCESMGSVNEGFGETYETVKQANGQFDKNFEADLQYKMVKGQTSVDVRTAQDVSKGIRHEFDIRKRWFNYISLFIRRILAFLFIRVFISAYQYNKKYLADIKHDNCYISAYFRRIDARRHTQFKGTFKILLRVMTCAVIIFMDYIVHEVLDIIRRHSHVNYHQSGHHHIAVIIYGNGIMGHIVRTLLNGFNQKHTLNNLTTNKHCLPRPVKMPTYYIWYILGTYAAIWVLMYFEAYGLRLRRVIAGFFYRKREKARTLFMYNDMLKKRKGFLRNMRHKIRALSREERLSRETDLLMALRYSYPKLCCCLNMFGLGKKRCLICEEPERRDTYHCKTPGCNFVYCQECWTDVKKRCYACAPAEEFDSESEMSEVDLDLL